MSRHLLARRAVVAAIAFALHLAAPARGDDLKLTNRSSIDSRMQELTFTTPALPTSTKVRVLLPAGYDASGATRYPVVYLLHGSTDDDTTWQTEGDIEQLTASSKAIFVMPDGGHEGLYTNWYNSGSYGQPAYETYHIGQLLPWIDANFPTLGTRAGRAIVGVSMGGGGAMSYAAKHPDLFVAAASFSGELDYTDSYSTGEIENAAAGNGTPGDPFGPRSTSLIRWKGANPSDLAANLSNTALYAYVGNGQPGGPYQTDQTSYDATEAGLHGENVTFTNRLKQLGIPIDFDDYGAGVHRWPYWRADMTDLLPKLMSVFAANRPNPPAFTYTSIDTLYGVYGWTVSVQRSGTEFSTLSDATSSGFGLSGSGSATVTSAALYQPNVPVAITVTVNGTATRTSVVTDSTGRVRVPVALTAAAAPPAQPAQAKVTLSAAGKKCTVKRVSTIRLRRVTARSVKSVSVRVGSRKAYVVKGRRSRVKVTLPRRSRVTLRVHTRGGRVLVTRVTVTGRRVCV